jgi:hypothetical protein
MLAYGIFYGFTRNRELSKIETERRRQEELERPAKEAALKAERDKKYKGESSHKFDDIIAMMRFFLLSFIRFVRVFSEEMDYLGRETGVIKAGSGWVTYNTIYNDHVDERFILFIGISRNFGFTFLDQ